MKRHQHGVTLLELMAVVVILGILASIAVPSYRGYVLRAQRSDATAAVLRVAAAQEKFYLQNNTYTTALTGANSLNLGSSNSERGYYSIAVTAPGGGITIANGFLVTATAISNQPQAKDTECEKFTVRETGERGSTKVGGGDTTAKCWR